MKVRAFVLSEPGRFHYEDREAPELREGHALLRVRSVGLCGTDLSSFRGSNPLVSYPRVPGHEIAATVVEVRGDAPPGIEPGANVAVSPYSNCGKCSSCRRGRPNACQFNETLGVQRDGAMTELISVPFSRIIFAGGMPLRTLGMVEPLTVGFHSVNRGRVTSSDTVAVFGCGGVGLGAVAGAAFRGARVIGVDVEHSKLELARKAGAAFTIHSTEENLHDRLAELTGAHGPDVIIEAIGMPATFRAAVDEVAWTGRVVYIGYAKEPVSYETRWFVQKELDIIGSRNAQPEDFAATVEMLRLGRFPVDDAISHVFPFAEAGEAFSSWSASPGGFRKILVEVNS
jgi:2-desacetyl-2-hydroxyethyl bacteriochlorophyllide A dehydrogenase